MVSILIVDDQPAVRRGLNSLLNLQADLMVIGEAADGVEAVQLAATLKPDVVLMDLEMPGQDGLTTTAQLSVEMPGTAVIVLSIHDDKTSRLKAEMAGAVAFVKKQGVEVLLETIRAIASLGTIPPPIMAGA